MKSNTEKLIKSSEKRSGKQKRITGTLDAKKSRSCKKNLTHFNLHEKVREVVANYRKSNVGLLLDESGNIISELENDLLAWMSYINQLFNDIITPTAPHD